MKATQLLLVLIPLAANAQRIVPAGIHVDGPGAEVNAMVEFNGKLIIGGRFDGVNGQVAPNIVSWDGGTGFDDMGLPMSSGPVLAMVPFGGGVVFSGSSHPQYRNIFFWNGNITMVIGTLSDGRVNAMTVFDNALYVGGSFTAVDGVPANKIARWDGTTWTSVGAGLNERVSALRVHDGSLFIGGGFTATADGTQELLHIARWDGAAFQPLDGGVDDGVTQLLDMPDALWLAGTFGSTGDSTLALERFARWDDNGFTPLLSGVTSTQTYRPMLVDLHGFGTMARAEKFSDRVFVNGEWNKAWLRGINCAEEFQGTTFVGGALESDEPDTTMAFGKLLPGSGHTEIEVAGLRAWIRSDGCLFYDQEEHRPDLIPVSEGGASAIFAHGHYVVGYAGDSAFTSSFTPYAAKEDYSQGPRCTERNMAFTDCYQRTWPIDIGMLWEHAASWADPGYTAPEVLTSWPGNGDTGNGEPALVARFQDNDGDGVYEPAQGELPVIKGDKAVLAEVSDQAADTLADIYPSMFDTQLLVHGYDSVTAELYQTIFATYSFTNRSQRTYDSVVVALTTMSALGCLDDDFSGCDPALDMYYFYNWDDFDNNCAGKPGFGAHPPAQGIVALNANMRSYLLYNRENASCCNDPQNTLHAVRYSEGVWKDGSPQINPLTNQPTRYMFTDYPDVPGGFHEPAQAAVTRSGIASFGPFFDVAPGESICFDMAFVFARDTTQDNIQNVRVLQNKVIALKEWYDQQPFGCGVYPTVGVREMVDIADGFDLYPNPASDQVRLSRTDASEPLLLQLCSSTGEVLSRIPWAGGSLTTSIDVRALADGVYVVRPLGSDGRVLRLVVAR